MCLWKTCRRQPPPPRDHEPCTLHRVNTPSRSRRRTLRPFTRVDRLVLQEIIGPTVVGFFVYTFLLMMRAIFGLVEEVLVRGLAVTDALRLIQVTVPHIVVLTLPTSFLFGVLIGIGRLHGDNETVALQVGGISLRSILKPVVAVPCFSWPSTVG